MLRVAGAFLLVAAGAGCALPPPRPPADLDPHPWQGLRGEARAAFEEHKFSKCAELFSQASEDGFDSPRDLVDGARCRVLSGRNADIAFRRLHRAAHLGWDDRAGLEADGAFSGIRRSRNWLRIMEIVDANRARLTREWNHDLFLAYVEEEEDRNGAEPLPDLEVRAERRRKKVTFFLNQGYAQTSADYFHAAVVFAQSSTPEEIAIGHGLALTATKLRPVHPGARWLVAATDDRLHMLKGEPQRYGTQFQASGDQWGVYLVDPNVSDEERTSWDVPPLSISRARAAKLERLEPLPHDRAARIERREPSIEVR